jgi:uncharacterized RDD family membrane protein YckC
MFGRDAFGSRRGADASTGHEGREASLGATAAGGLTFDPYAPPATLDARPKAVPGTRASRWRRLAGASIDGLFEGALQLAAAYPLHRAGLDPFSAQSIRGVGTLDAPSPMLHLLCSLIPTAVQWTLIARSGQSLGKKAVGTVMVTTEGRAAGFVHGALLRAAPWLALGFVNHALVSFASTAAFGRAFEFGTIGLALVDCLFIFRSDRRCIHDHIAGTNVVRVGSVGRG